MKEKLGISHRTLKVVCISGLLMGVGVGCKDESLVETEQRSQVEINKARQQYNDVVQEGMAEVNREAEDVHQAEQKVREAASAPADDREDAREDAIENLEDAREDLHEKVEDVAEEAHDAGVKIEDKKLEAVEDMVDAAEDQHN